MSSPWLSILIPVYNVEPYVIDCLESISRQSCEGIEIILIDDVSTDASMRLVEAYKEQSPLSIKLLYHTTNQGLSAARNSLLAAAQGEYIWFVDSDDALQDGAIDSLRRIAFEQNPDLILCDYHIWRIDEVISSRQAQNEKHVKTLRGIPYRLQHMGWQFFCSLYQKGKLHVWSKISKRSLWTDDLAFPVGKYFEDMVLTPRLAVRAKNYVYCPEIWINYRRRDSSILANPNLEKVQDMISGLQGVQAVWEYRFGNMPMNAKVIFFQFAMKIFRFALKDLRTAGMSLSRSIKASLRQRFLKSLGSSKYELITLFYRQRDYKRCMRALFI